MRKCLVFDASAQVGSQSGSPFFLCLSFVEASLVEQASPAERGYNRGYATNYPPLIPTYREATSARLRPLGALSPQWGWVSYCFLSISASAQ